MNKLYSKFLLFILLSLAGVSAFAEQNSLFDRFFGTEKTSIVVNDASQQVQHAGRQDGRTAKYDLSIDRVQSNDGRRQGTGDTVAAKKKNRLTPDERRALRQQIHEAGNDLYVKPR